MKPIIEEIIREHIIAMKEAMSSGQLKKPDDYLRIARLFKVVLTECSHCDPKAKKFAQHWAATERQMRDERDTILIAAMNEEEVS